LQGEPRATHDIDLVIELQADKIDPLLAEFLPPDFYVDRTAIEQAILRQGMFNVLNVHDGNKIDFWMLTDDEFDQSFRRRAEVKIEGANIFVSTAEDTVLMKLKWDREAGGSLRQFHDALRVYELQHAIMDQAYLASWITALRLEESWQRLLAQANPIA
jgi:hypothetical protein